MWKWLFAYGNGRTLLLLLLHDPTAPSEFITCQESLLWSLGKFGGGCYQTTAALTFGPYWINLSLFCLLFSTQSRLRHMIYGCFPRVHHYNINVSKCNAVIIAVIIAKCLWHIFTWNVNIDMLTTHGHSKILKSTCRKGSHLHWQWVVRA